MWLKKICKKFQYWFDNQMAKGTISLIKFLVIVILAFVLLVGIIISKTSNGTMSFFDSFWNTLASTVNAWVVYMGDLVGKDDIDGSTLAYILMACAGIVGLLVTSVLIGIFSSAIEEKIEQLKKGKSQVLEQGHIVLLGFNINTYKVIEELCLSGIPKCILVAGDAEKDYMESQIKSNVQVPPQIRIVCRNIDITDQTEMECCSIEEASAVVIIHDNDDIVLRTILVVSSLLKNSEHKPSSLIAIMNRRHHMEAAKYAGENNFLVFHAGTVVAKVMAQACVQVGISRVFDALFSYQGSEIYFKSCRGLSGMSFGDVLIKIKNGTPLGVFREGKANIAPLPTEPVYEDDQLIVLSEENDKLEMDDGGSYDTGEISNPYEYLSNNDNIGIVGYTHYLEVILDELYKGKRNIYISGINESKRSKVDKIIQQYNGAVRVCDNEYFDDITGELQHIILLSDESLDKKAADDKTISKLLELRANREKKQLRFNTIVQIQQQKAKDLLMEHSDSEYIVTSDIASLVTAQLVFNKDLAVVFRDILSNEGSEIFMAEAGAVLDAEKEYTMRELREILIKSRVVFLGYVENDDEKLVLNPRLEMKKHIGRSDKLIMLSDKDKQH